MGRGDKEINDTSYMEWFRDNATKTPDYCSQGLCINQICRDSKKEVCNKDNRFKRQRLIRIMGEEEYKKRYGRV